ncbi:MAG: cysteine--tRNA ligase [Patescibacteria group bacterium]|nr:cysteine--tRNA ligase [Patescibacteria group bacterium]
MRVFNTLTRKKETIKPIKKGQISMYACGPTVYQSAHIGNLKTYLVEDLLKRALQFEGYKVKHIMNITDVGHLTSDADSGEDKVEKEAKRQRKTAKQITKFYADEFKRDLKKLNILPPNKFAWASQYIKSQIDLIKKLEKKGYTYRTADGIYFDTSKFKKYGALGRQTTGKSRVTHDKSKKRDADFALWKFSGSAKRQQEWPSPWGVGFPGWHIECSAISTKELGQPFDIHLGGEDHILVHHNNEIAQSEAACGKPLAHYWVHSAFMLLGKDKMSKSKGNFITLSELEKRGWDPMVFRYLVISSQYRSKLNFSETALVSARNSLNKIYNLFAARKTGGRVCKKRTRAFLAALQDDLNMPAAFEVVWELIKTDKKSLADKQATLLHWDKVLGLGLKDYKLVIPAKVKELVKKREVTRKKKNWSMSDKLRGEIQKQGFDIKDTPSGAKLIKL